MMKYISLFFLVGVCLLGYSFTMEPYTDRELFVKKYAELSDGQSKEFFALRDSMVTPKYRLQDTGITLLSISLVAVLILKLGRHPFKSPNTATGFVLLAIGLPFISVLGFIWDLMQSMRRDEFPSWADSLGIPLAGVPFQLMLLLFWSFLHLGFLMDRKVSPHNIAPSRSHNYWLLFLSLVTGLCVLMSLFFGHYWYVVPGLGWLYFYLSLAAVRLTEPVPPK